MSSAMADTWVFKDVLRPGGQSRSLKEKLADAHKCGAVGSSFSDAVLPNMKPCMSTHGWTLDHVIADRTVRYAQRPHNSRSYEEDYQLRKRNWEASDAAEAQRDDEARNDEFRNQVNGP
jgi:hypothetical protein